jgi:hypothetical protein
MTGYSYKSNEHGLSVDTVTEFHLVSPNGTEIVVTEAEKDLWFALKVCLTMATKIKEKSSVLAFTTGRIQQLREFQIVTLRMSLKLTTLYRQGNRDQVYPQIVSANRCLGVSLSLLIRRDILTRIRKGAFLSFEGDLADQAAEAVSKFLSRPRDRKATQLGSFVYSNGSVSL